MQRLAQELGYPVTFPTYCWYCGEVIYLHATPEGGFVIFDSLGPPWPKHDCGGITPESSDYVDFSPVFSNGYTFPVPESTVTVEAEGPTLSGTVVEVISIEPSALLAKYKIYDGQELKIVFSPLQLAEGQCVQGTIEMRKGRPVLSEARVIRPDLPIEPSRLGEETVSSVPGLSFEAMWKLQFDAWTLPDVDRQWGSVLAGALDALVNGKLLTAVALLTQFVTARENAVAKETKSDHLHVLLLVLQAMDLLSPIPSLKRLVTRKTLKSLSPDTSALLDRLTQLAEFEQTTGKGRQRFEKYFKKEERYIELQRKRRKIDIHKAIKEFSELL